MNESRDDAPVDDPTEPGEAKIELPDAQGRAPGAIGDDDSVGDGHADDEVEPLHPGRPWIRYARVGFAGVLFALGLFIFAQSFEFGWESRGTPGPGFFPFWVGLLIALTSLAWGINEFRSSIADQFQQDIDPEGVWRVVQIVVAFAVLILVFEPVGYNLSVLAFMLYMTYTMGRGKGRIWVMVVTSLVASFGVYLIFEHALGVRLPDSIIPLMAQFGL